MVLVRDGQRFLRRQLHVPALRAQVLEHDAAVLVRQPTVFVQLHLEHETQLAQQQRERFGQHAEVVARGEPDIGIGLAMPGVAEAVPGRLRRQWGKRIGKGNSGLRKCCGRTCKALVGWAE